MSLEVMCKSMRSKLPSFISSSKFETCLIVDCPATYTLAQVNASAAQWDAVQNVNLRGAFLLAPLPGGRPAFAV